MFYRTQSVRIIKRINIYNGNLKINDNDYDCNMSYNDKR
jgi:hypothetical protein